MVGSLFNGVYRKFKSLKYYCKPTWSCVNELSNLNDILTKLKGKTSWAGISTSHSHID